MRTGKLKAIATGGTTRLAVLPDVQTVAESGLPGYDSVGWAGIFVPRGTPSQLARRLREEYDRLGEVAKVAGLAQ